MAKKPVSGGCGMKRESWWMKKDIDTWLG